jgi:hypothetical protein
MTSGCRISRTSSSSQVCGKRGAEILAGEDGHRHRLAAALVQRPRPAGQPQALALTLNDQAVAVVLDFVFGLSGRNAGFNRGFGHAVT